MPALVLGQVLGGFNGRHVCRRLKANRDACKIPTNNRKVHGEEETTAVSGVEDVPPQSRRRHRIYGSVRPHGLSFRLLYGFLILAHRRRKILWLGVTAHPSAECIAGQLTEAFGWEQAPRYIVRDWDGDGHLGSADRPTIAMAERTF